MSLIDAGQPRAVRVTNIDESEGCSWNRTAAALVVGVAGPKPAARVDQSLYVGAGNDMGAFDKVDFWVSFFTPRMIGAVGMRLSRRAG